MVKFRSVQGSGDQPTITMGRPHAGGVTVGSVALGSGAGRLSLSGSRGSETPSHRSMAFTVYDDTQQPQLQPQDSKPVLSVHKSFDPDNSGKYQDKENMQSLQKVERAEHERCIERGELRCTPSEQLDRWIDYIKWSQRAGDGKVQVLDLLERCTKTFKADRSLRNQRKYLRVWINYADMSYDKEGVFEFMWANKIGITHALYYEAASAMHETGKGTLDGEPDLKRAMKMLAVGIKMQADPVDRLHQRKKELKRRALRRIQNERAHRASTLPTAMQVVAEEEVSEPVVVASNRDLAEESAETQQTSEQAERAEPERCPEPQQQLRPEPESAAAGTSSLQSVCGTESPLAQRQEKESTVKVFDVSCDDCSVDCSEESWRLEQADEDLCPTCYLNRKTGNKDERISVQEAVRQKDGQNIPEACSGTSSAAASICNAGTKNKSKSRPRKPLAVKQVSTNEQGVQKRNVSKQEKQPGQQRVTEQPRGDDENGDDPDDGSEPWVGTKKAKARRRKRVYKPTFEGEAPSAEDGGFSLFTDKNGRDCR